jgi:hypothetical protein
MTIMRGAKKEGGPCDDPPEKPDDRLVEMREGGRPVFRPPAVRASAGGQSLIEVKSASKNSE